MCNPKWRKAIVVVGKQNGGYKNAIRGPSYGSIGMSRDYDAANMLAGLSRRNLLTVERQTSLHI
jgi:hypothetical protein